MAKDLFSVPIFFILFRETLEAAIIVSVLLALVEQLVKPKGGLQSEDTTLTPSLTRRASTFDESATLTDDDKALTDKKLLRKLRIQIFAGAGVGLFVALAIGAAFIAVFYTKVKDLYAKSEDLWEGIFALIAAIMIWVMGLGFLKMDRSKIKWKLKMQKAFMHNENLQGLGKNVKQSKSSKYALFILPAITVAREGLEAVVFLGGVSLSEPGSSIPIAAICGILAGIVVGYLLYKSSSRLNMSIFVVGSTCFLLLIGAGLLSKAVGFFETYRFVQLVGSDVAEAGTGPGSYNVHGNVWHLNCCSPEAKDSGYGWTIFNAILGWTNNATIGTILSYIVYWLSVVMALFYLKWSEGRISFFGIRSAAYHRQQERRLQAKNVSPAETEEDMGKKEAGLDVSDSKEEPMYELRMD